MYVKVLGWDGGCGIIHNYTFYPSSSSPSLNNSRAFNKCQYWNDYIWMRTPTYWEGSVLHHWIKIIKFWYINVESKPLALLNYQFQTLINNDAAISQYKCSI